jgi:hypothetical protein
MTKTKVRKAKKPQDTFKWPEIGAASRRSAGVLCIENFDEQVEACVECGFTYGELAKRIRDIKRDASLRKTADAA